MKRLLFILIGIIIYLCVFTGFVTASIQNNQHEYQSFVWVEVLEGDTLWSIADQYNDQNRISVHKMLELIYEANQLQDSYIYPKQKLKIPVCENMSSIS